jgi:hypothetical protein
MLHKGTADAPDPRHYDLCVVRARHPLGLRSGVVYEALCLRGDAVEVLAATCKAAAGSAKAANARRNLEALLRHDGWQETEGTQPVGPDIVAHYVRHRTESSPSDLYCATMG